jgi:hypothetical protein
MRKSLLFIVILFPFWVFSQPNISFINETHDFGEVVEGKVATHEFVFTNTGNAPLIIQNVQASCGCTSPFWTKEPVMPGKTGTIKASYNSAGRPGPFTKSLTITSNAANTPSKVVYIKGMVINKENKVYTEAEKANSPIVSLAKNTYKVGKLEVGQTGTAKVAVTNTGKSNLEFTDVQSVCGCVTFQVNKSSIGPGESAVLELNIKPRNEGSIREVVTINSNDIVSPAIKVTLEGEAVQAMGKLMGGGSAPFK